VNLLKKSKRAIKDVVFQANRVSGLERQGNLLGEIRAGQILQTPKLECIADAEFSVHSQWGEDGIISWLVDVVQPKNTNFVEFGVEDYRESNTRFLLMTRNWSGLVIDGSEDNISDIRKDTIAYKYDLKPVCSFITRDNIGQILDGNGFNGDLGLLSVDIDGVDYWVLEAIKNKCDIIIVEYNDHFGPHPHSVPYDAAFSRLDKHKSGIYWGASLQAFTHLLSQRGMTLIGTNRVGTNAFYVRNEHVAKVKKRLSSFRAWPCKMREARTVSGELAYKTYAESAALIAGFPLIDVTNGEQVQVGQVKTPKQI
jgi:hypothetical protein